MDRKTTSRINAVSSAVITIAVRVIIFGLLFLVLIKGLKIAYDFGHGIFYATSVDNPPGKDIEVSVPENTDAGQIADLLEVKGLIDNKISFRFQEKFFKYDIKPGKYMLNTSMTSREILSELDAGPPEELLSTQEEGL